MVHLKVCIGSVMSEMSYDNIATPEVIESLFSLAVQATCQAFLSLPADIRAKSFGFDYDAEIDDEDDDE